MAQRNYGPKFRAAAAALRLCAPAEVSLVAAPLKRSECGRTLRLCDEAQQERIDSGDFRGLPASGWLGKRVFRDAQRRSTGTLV